MRGASALSLYYLYIIDKVCHLPRLAAAVCWGNALARKRAAGVGTAFPGLVCAACCAGLSCVDSIHKGITRPWGTVWGVLCECFGEAGQMTIGTPEKSFPLALTGASLYVILRIEGQGKGYKMRNQVNLDRRQDKDTRSQIDNILGMFPDKAAKRYWLGVLVQEGRLSEGRAGQIMMEKGLI